MVSVTSAFETQVLVVSSKTDSVYSTVLHAVSRIPAMARFYAGSMRTVTDACAPSAMAA